MKTVVENKVFSYHRMAGDNGKRKLAPDYNDSHLKFMNDLKELVLSEIRKAYFNLIRSHD